MMKRKQAPKALGKGWQRAQKIRHGVQAVQLLSDPPPPRIRRSQIKHVSLAHAVRLMANKS